MIAATPKSSDKDNQFEAFKSFCESLGQSHRLEDITKKSFAVPLSQVCNTA
jgi:hypothetical protein